MQGADLVRTTLRGGEPARPPYIPVLGSIVEHLGQLPGPLYDSDPQRQARALVETATALHADAVTVGLGAPGDSGLEVLRRIRPLLGGRAAAGVVSAVDVALARAFCENEVDVLIVAPDDAAEPARLRSLGNACRFYRVPVIYLPPDPTEPAEVVSTVEEAGLAGAILAEPEGAESSVVGGGLSEQHLDDEHSPAPVRRHGFFWSFAGEVPTEHPPEALAGLGQRLQTI